ncbi:EF-P 5-aminopentanol modification-associated protein YfmH [Enterococcus canis]|uniref:EF-P 5-aminopentanol modification-associated protein YfmH n=1 Tax=Enterococcus canis TaxID=214095 RepID=UPI00082FF30C|nr:pitrilysin family protein [Enterococcus canis]
MHKHEYQQINETLYTEVLANGLTVHLLPKPDYHKTYGLFTTNYGSIDNHFVPLSGEAAVTVPDGIAHFLEHKMFEKETGDVFQVFSQQGASANAFTSFTRTSYLFSSTDHVAENVATLIDFVQAPYFTAETVEKEKGIIGQEIQMYQDEPNWRLFFGLLQNLYPEHPLHIDIAGTVASIAEITAEDLYTCYHTFYHPSNMNLFLVGRFEPEAMMALIRENQEQKEFAKPQPIQRFFPEGGKIVPVSEERMSLTRPKVLVGIKGTGQLPTGRQLLKFKTAISLLLQLLLGDTSQNYLDLYDEGLLDDSFGYEFSLDREFHFADFGGDSDQPERLAERLTTILSHWQTDAEITPENLDLLKKRSLGKYFQSLNSLEYIANQFSQSMYGDATLFDLPEIIQSLTLADLKAAGEQFIQPENFSTFYLLPKV